ncbi:hypothetical protein BD410DRAFT_781608 [Rickenella mellea]|uniref:DUF7587 domain-containing protein n=1 Tax=Rickenella mellea TaxID=50990 RepID=A0A4Y7QJ86_9AGAM|nr:hypothetical protein BD410DRAFT_781608 [Rickenella mellea]
MPEYKCSVNPYALPRVGFGDGRSREFWKLVKGNRFLFRVQDRRSKVKQLGDGGFLAAALRYPPATPQPSFDYESVMEHIRWDSRVKTPYISASFSLAWAVWEADRRVGANNRDVCIAVIDGARIQSNAAEVALGILEEWGATASSKNFASASQEVLIYAHVPADAVISIYGSEFIAANLPPWYNPLADFPISNTSYTDFCEIEATRRHQKYRGKQRMAKFALQLAQSTIPPDTPSKRWSKLAFGIGKHYIVWTMDPSQSSEEMDRTVKIVRQLSYLVKDEVKRRRYEERYAF